MKIRLTRVYVDDQDKALRFYTDVLGLVKKTDVSQGPYRWLTVASPDEPDGTELQLALNDNPAAGAYQQAMFQQSQPAVMFFTDDVKTDYKRIKARGAEFTMPAHRGDRLDHRHVQRHLRQPHSTHAVDARVGRTLSSRPSRTTGFATAPSAIPRAT
jgi:predicted enzyme related to lactoylglutathione lyase